MVTNSKLKEKESTPSPEDLPYLIFLGQSLSLPKFFHLCWKVLICKDTGDKEENVAVGFPLFP